MSERLQLGALLAAALLVAAFAGSFALGISGPRRASAPPVTAPSSGAPTVPVQARGRLEVLNASGKSGQARRATELLRAAGFDVVYFGNAGAGADSSLVIDRVGDLARARVVADRLGVANVVSRPDSTLLVDATVVLAPDWPSASHAVSPPARNWWSRIRRWFRRDSR